MNKRVRYPHGLIARVETHKTHRKFINAVQPDQVMVKHEDAERLVGRGETASSYFGPETTVVVTTTQDDRSLSEITWDDEFDMLRRFKPDFTIPADYPTYVDDEEKERMENVKNCMRGTVYIHEKIQSTPTLNTSVIPLIKGITPRERRVCYSVFRQREWEYAAYYGTQYFTGGEGGRVWELERDLRAVANETSGELGILLIGALADYTLTKMPSSVVAAAGMHRWRTAVEPQKNPKSTMQSEYTRVGEAVTEALNNDESDVIRPQAVEQNEG